MKDYVSAVEDKRLDFEELNRHFGKRVLPQQIWRDGNLIPGSPKDITFEAPQIEDGAAVQYFNISDGATVVPLIKKISLLTLKRVEGTTNAYYHEQLKNIITREFDKDPNNLSRSWHYKIHLNDTPIAYQMGDPYIDIVSGILIFRNEEFLKKLTDEAIKVSFYRYTGRTGFVGSENNEQDVYGGVDLPFRDDIKHFKDHTNDAKTATFEVGGEEGNSVYVLPAPTKIFNESNGNALDENGIFYPVNNKKGVVMLQENYQEIDWRIGVHNGGTWDDDGNVTKL